LAIGLLLVITGVAEDEHFKREPALTQIVGGVRYAFSTPVLKMVQLLNIAVAFFGLAYISMGPGFGREELHLNASGTGFFIMASGVGAIVAALVLVMHEVNDRNRAVCLMCGAFGASLLAICLSPNVATAFAFMAVFGFSNSCFSILAQTIFQLSAEPRYLGRVIGLWSMGGGVGQLTALPIGVAGDAFGLRWSLGFVAVMLVLSSAAVAALLLPRIRLRAAPALANAAT
jgi:predicted MFS family arabinose efflux permease